MVNRRSDPGKASSALLGGDGGARAAEPSERPQRPHDVSGVNVRDLSPGTALAVDTANSRYRLVILEGGGSRALVQGGRYFEHEAEARIEGSMLGGSLLWTGWIGRGFSLELSSQGRHLETSRVRSITIVAPTPT